MFKEQFANNDQQSKLEAQFEYLRQGNLLVNDFYMRFLALASYTNSGELG